MPCGVVFMHPNQQQKDKQEQEENNTLGSAKCGREKLHPKGRLPQLRGDFC